MTPWPTLLAQLETMPDELEQALQSVPANQLDWEPASSGGAPGEGFSARGHACHLRDIERDGYHVRFRRMLEENEPSLVSLDGYELARERQYATTDVREALASFRAARTETVARLRGLGEPQLERAGDFAEYGRLTVRALGHYLRSHDLQHLAGLQWLAGRAASAAVASSPR